MEAINKDEMFDEELCGMVNFEDETVQTSKPVEAEKNYAEAMYPNEKKAAHRTSRKPADAKWEPVKTFYDERIVRCLKWFGIFVGLEYLFFHWQQTGQMQSSAAVPSMIVCAFLAGFSVGKNWIWRK